MTAFNDKISRDLTASVPLEPPETPLCRVVATMGGKGGCGKTTWANSYVCWLDANGIPCHLVDADVENKTKGSLWHYFPDRAIKLDIHTPDALDPILNKISAGVPVVVLDLGASSGNVVTSWFDELYTELADLALFTAVGMVTEDPATVESVLTWASKLQGRVSYLIVKSMITKDTKFNYWENSSKAKEFRELFNPPEMQMDYRNPALESVSRNYGAPLNAIVNGHVDFPELKEIKVVTRAKSIQRRIFAEFNKVEVKEVLL
jgi:hypothetical protein